MTSRFSAENEAGLAALEQHLAAHDYLGGYYHHLSLFLTTYLLAIPPMLTIAESLLNYKV